MALYVKASPSMILSRLRAVALRSSTNITNFSTSTVAIEDKDLVDATLAKVLKYEINTAKSILKVSQGKPPTSPFEFENRGCSSFFREFPDGEELTVTVRANDRRDGDEVKDDMKTSPAIPMGVQLWRPNGENKFLRFDVIVSEEDIVIENYYLIKPKKGAKIQDLDPRLERWLSKYLQKRDIKSIASFLIHNKHLSTEAKKIDSLSFMKHLQKIIRK